MHGNHKIDGCAAVCTGEIGTRLLGHATAIGLSDAQVRLIANITGQHRAQYLALAAEADQLAAQVAALDKAGRDFPINLALIQAHTDKLRDLSVLTLTNIRNMYLVITDEQRAALAAAYEAEKAIRAPLPAGRQ